MKVLIKPKVTKPWSKEMYDYNDKVADMMKAEIRIKIESNKCDWDTLNELMELCGGIKYGMGYDVTDLYEGCLEELENVQNYWLRDEYPYQVDKGLVKDVGYEFIGY